MVSASCVGNGSTSTNGTGFGCTATAVRRFGLLDDGGFDSGPDGGRGGGGGGGRGGGRRSRQDPEDHIKDKDFRLPPQKDR